MRNNLGHRVQIELFRDGADTPAVIGTDYIVFIDGRWSQATAVAHIEEYVDTYTRNERERTGMEWRRSVYRLRRRDSVTI